MQQADSLIETAHKPADPAIAVAMMTGTIGSPVPGSRHDSAHESTHKSKAKTASPKSDDSRTQERDRINPERFRTSPDRTSAALTSANLLSPNLLSPNLMRAETLAATLTTLRSQSETLTEVAHDARNMVTALGLYCEFLEEPGVLATPFVHYGQELRLVAAASRRLVEKIVALDFQTNAKISAQEAANLAILAAGLSPSGVTLSGLAPVTQDGESGIRASGAQRESGIYSNPNRRYDLLPTVPVANLAAELALNHNLLAALAGPSIVLTVHAAGCALPVWLSGEDLTRVLVNLVKNSAEAMLSGGRIDICLRELHAEQASPEPADAQPADQGAAACLLLTVEDNGPGIPTEAVETIFASGFTSHDTNEGHAHGSPGTWYLSHRGLGLTISRSIVEGAGGRITAANREQGGARFALELPLRQAS